MTITSLAPLSPPWAIAVTNRGPAGVGATVTVNPVAIDMGPDGIPGVIVTGNETHVGLQFQLKSGDQGDVGPAPILTIGDVTDVAAGNAATAEINGPDGGPYTLDLGLPSGADGEDGESGYVYVRYATASDGTGFSATPSDARIYMAVKTTTSPIASPVAGDFTGLWRLTKGIQGDAGTPGTPGATGPAGEVTGSATLTDNMIVRGDGGAKVIQPTAIYVDDNNKLLWGVTTAQTWVSGQTVPLVQVHGVDDGSTGISQWRYSANTSSAFLRWFKSRAASILGRAVVASGDAIGRLVGLADDGTNFINAAEIRMTVDGTPGTNDMPGAVIIATTADGGSTLIDRIKISCTGLFTTYFDAFITGVLDLGHASDTTIARDTAGKISVESKRLLSEWVVGTPVAATGANLSINNLDCDDLMVVLEGVSHATASGIYSLLLSIDNGATFPHSFAITASTAISATVSGMVRFTGLRSGYVYTERCTIDNAAADLSAVRTQGTVTPGVVKAGAKINAVRLINAGGALDAGFVTLLQRG